MSDEPKPASGQVFPISTLKDVFNLPTVEQIETCMDEMKAIMIQAKTMDVALSAIAEAHGQPVEHAVIWPDSVDWIDDGRGEVGVTYNTKDGQRIFETEQIIKQPKDN